MNLQTVQPCDFAGSLLTSVPWLLGGHSPVEVASTISNSSTEDSSGLISS